MTFLQILRVPAEGGKCYLSPWLRVAIEWCMDETVHINDIFAPENYYDNLYQLSNRNESETREYFTER
jgi:hypothetical protein